MKQRVLITGSNGVLGKNLIQYLENYASGRYELVLFDVKIDVEPEMKYETYQGDIRDQARVEQVMKGIDIVVHCAGASPSYEPSAIVDIIVNGTSNMLDCAFNIGNVERFIYISSTSVYGVPRKVPVYEDDEVVPYDPYNKSKIEAEKLCQEWRAKGRCITVLRPRSFIGPGRLGTFGILYEWASEGKNFPMVGSGMNQYQLLDVEDLCQAIYMALGGDREKINDLFNIGAKDFTVLKEDYQAVLDEAGFNKKIICLPAKPMFILLNILERLKLSPFYKRLYLKLNKDYYVSIEKAQQQLGYLPKYSNKDALLKNYHWYLQQKESLVGKTGASNNAIWKQGVLRLAKLFF